ncbi:hypothetical protein [Kordiimonas gwangyangensis]|uniref:hypothetical protein n=1 Tax=Kordiimonas gwangyangensis TaxID=288022 RepID=UPI0012DF7693|nr:hypothetical protein [Kordiimonas gwangyangensis]
MFRSGVWALLLALCALPVFADADAPATIPLKDLFTGYDEFLEKSSERMLIIAPVYSLAARLARPEEVELTFDYDGKPFTFRPMKDGRLRFRPSAQMLEANPEVVTNQPRGTLAVTMVLDIVMVARNRYPIDELHDRVHKAWGQAKSFRGLMSIFSSSHSKVMMHFPSSCTETKWMVTKRGSVIASGAGVSKVTLDFSEKVVRKADQLLLSCRPDRFSLN